MFCCQIGPHDLLIMMRPTGLPANAYQPLTVQLAGDVGEHWDPKQYRRRRDAPTGVHCAPPGLKASFLVPESHAATPDCHSLPGKRLKSACNGITGFTGAVTVGFLHCLLVCVTSYKGICRLRPPQEASQSYCQSA